MTDIRGHLLLLMAPSGSGKKMMLDGLGALANELYLAKTYTSRARREDAEENPKYVFISREEFEQMIADDALVEWADFSDNLYGTAKADVLEALQEPQVVYKEMELQGVLQMKKIVPEENMTVVYIDAGSWEDLEERILARAAISEEHLRLRKERYMEESKFKDGADLVVMNRNGEAETAQAEFRSIVGDIIKNVTT